MKKVWVLFAVTSLIFACNQENGEKENDAQPADSTAMVTDSQEVEIVAADTLPSTGNFGAEITPDGAMTMEELETTMEGHDSLVVKVTGTVSAVCQKKGCWLTIDRPNGEAMRVRFKDYGFFVPKDCPGKTAILQGVAKRVITSVEELKHYAKDQGKSEEEIATITEPEESLEFIAEGVIIM